MSKLIHIDGARAAERDAPSPVADQASPAASGQMRRIFVTGLRLPAHIGCYEHEQGAAQPVIIDFELDVEEPQDPLSDSLEDVVCYDKITGAIKAILDEGHIKLVETLAERIAEMALSHPMARAVMVRVAKPDAIAEAGGAGVEIRRIKRGA